MRSCDVVSQSDQDAIINLWSVKQINGDYKTKVCGIRVCRGENCKYSHAFALGYPIVRCKECSLYNCPEEYITHCTERIMGGIVHFKSICRRVAFELEDERNAPKLQIPEKKKARKEEPKFTFEPSKPYQQISLQPPKNIPKPPVQVEKPITKKKGAEGELSYYYIRCTPATKNALVNIVQDADFQGFIKISDPCLQKALRKLPENEIIKMKPDLIEFPEFDSVVERADLRIQNAELRKQLTKKK